MWMVVNTVVCAQSSAISPPWPGQRLTSPRINEKSRVNQCSNISGCVIKKNQTNRYILIF